MFRLSFDSDLKVVCLVVPVGMPVATHENILFFIWGRGHLYFPGWHEPSQGPPTSKPAPAAGRPCEGPLQVATNLVDAPVPEVTKTASATHGETRWNAVDEHSVATQWIYTQRYNTDRLEAQRSQTRLRPQ